MKRLLALLLIAWPLQAADTTVAQNVEIVSIEDRAVQVEVEFSGSVADWRLAWGTNGTTFPHYGEPGRDTGDDVLNVTGVDAGATIYIRPEVDTDGNGTYDTSYDCSTDAGFDGTPRQSSTGSASCPTTVIQVVLEADAGFTPASPSNIEDWESWTPSGDEYTVASCSNAALQAEIDDCEDAAISSGEYGVIEIPWNCDFEIDLNRHFSSTAFACRIQSDRTGTNYCPPAGVMLDPIMAEECAPTLRIADYGVQGGWTNSAPTKWIWTNIVFAGAEPSSTTFVEGGAVSSVTDDSGDAVVTTNVDHNIATGEDPNRVILYGCKDSSGDFTSANGAYEYTTEDADEIRLTGAAGIDCTQGGNLIQEADEYSKFLGWDSGEMIFDRVIFDCSFPCRAQSLIQAGADGLQVVDSMVRGGNWATLVGSTPDAGSEYSNNMDGVPGFGFLTGQYDEMRFRNVMGVGAWAFFIGNDTGVSNPATDIDIDTIWNFKPDYLVDASADSANDGIEDIVFACRHMGYEFKTAQRVDVRGWLVSGGTQCPGAQNAQTYGWFIRNQSGNSETSGSSDFYHRSLVAHNTIHAVSLEGSDFSRGEAGSMAGRFVYENILANKLDLRAETGKYAPDFAGEILNLSHTGNKVRFVDWTVYRPQFNYGPFYAAYGMWSGVQIEDGIIAGLPRAPDGEAIWTSHGIGGSGSSQSCDFDGEEGGDFFACLGYVSEEASGTSDSYFRDVVLIPGCESAGCTEEAATGTGGGAMTLAEVTAQCSTSTSLYDIPDCQVGGDNDDDIITNIGTLGLGLRLEYDGTGAGSGDEGYDPDQGDQDLGIIRPYTSRTNPIELERNGNTGWTAYLKAPSTDRTCYMDYRPTTGGAWTRASDSTAARDRTMSSTGLAAGTQYQIRFACEQSGPWLRTQGAPGGPS